MRKDRLRFIIIAVILIAAAGSAVYFNSLKGEFLWDDEWIVSANPYIRTFKFLPQVFSTGIFQAYGVGKGSFYRPLQILAYMIDYKFWRLSPAGYHLTNTALHIACAILLFAIINLLTGDLKPAFIASLLFVVHPIHTQAVTYISGRADPLSAAFMLLSLLCFIRYSKIASFAFFILALLTKEAAVVLPLFLLLYIFSFKAASSPPRLKAGADRNDSASTLPFFAVIAVYAILRHTALDFSEGTFLSDTPLYLRLLTTCKNIFAYLGLLIAPVGLHMERRIIFVKSIFEPKVIASLGALFIIALWMRRVRKRNSAAFFFAGWFLFGLLPVSNIFPLNATLAEHWAYFPSMGVFALLGIGCASLLGLRKNGAEFARNLPWLKGLGRTVPIFILGAVLVYGFITVRRNNDWRDGSAIYLATKKYVPGNYKVRNNLGRLYFNKGMLDEAIEEYKASLQIQPEYAQAHSNLGVAYAVKKEYEKAIEEYESALRLRSDLSKTYNNLADACIKTGRPNKALETYRKGTENCPADPYL